MISTTQAMSNLTAQQVLRQQQNAGSVGSETISWTMLCPSANALRPADQALITAATGAQFQMTPQGLQMTQLYQSGVPINAEDYSAALAQVQQDLKENGVATASPEVAKQLALGQAEFGYVQNFTNAMISLRQSIGPDQAITPSLIIAAVKQSNASSATIPQDYVANTIGYMNGIG